MTIRELRDLINEIERENPADMDAPCILQSKTDMPHVFVFEEVCPSATEMITVGPSPAFLDDHRGENSTIEMRALLIAPHSFHDETDEENENKKALN